MARVIHIIGVVCGFIAATAQIIAGIVYATQRAAPPVAPGKLLSIGIACLAGAIVATLDGAQCYPQFGIWKIGAKWQGLGDAAVLTIFLLLGTGVGVSFAFN